MPDNDENQLSKEKGSLTPVDRSPVVEKDSSFPLESKELGLNAASFDATWSKAEETALVRRLDRRIMPLVTFLYLCNFIDCCSEVPMPMPCPKSVYGHPSFPDRRVAQYQYYVTNQILPPHANSLTPYANRYKLVPAINSRVNIGNAKVAGLTTDLGLVGFQYNIGLSVFYVAYIVVEVPSNLLLKRFGATLWLSSLVLAFGLVCFCTAFMKNFAQFMVIRILLGIAEGGMMPGIAYYLSTWYKRDELALRMGIFVSAASMAGAFSGLLATGFLSVPQLDGLPTGPWRNIFLFEGVITVLAAFLGFRFLPKSPSASSFLGHRQSFIAIQRIQDENAGQVEEESTAWDLVLRAWCNMTNWICSLGFLFTNISIQGMVLFMPSLLAGMGYSDIESQLLTVPPYILASIWSITLAWLSQRSSKRGLWILVSAPICVVGSSLLIGSGFRAVQYTGIFLLAMGAFPLGPLFLTWASNNSAPYTTRAVSSAMVVSLGSLGPIVSAWVYLPNESPRYLTGLSVQLGAQIAIYIITVFLILWNMRENRLRRAGKRDYLLDADSATVARLGNLNPKFRLTI